MSSGNFSDPVKLNVGGTYYSTSIATLTKFPDSMLGAMFSGRHSIQLDDGAVFIDRDGILFRHILNFLRYPNKFAFFDFSACEIRQLKLEADFYGLREYMFPFRRLLYEEHVERSYYLTQNEEGLWSIHRSYYDKPNIYVALTYCRFCDFACALYDESDVQLSCFSEKHDTYDCQPHPSSDAPCIHCNSKH